MAAPIRSIVWVLALTAALYARGSASHATSSRQALDAPRVEEQYGRLPLGFERNEGQTDDRVQFLSRGPGYTMFLTRGAGAVMTLAQPSGSGAVLRLTPVGGDATARATGRDELPGKVNYLRGQDRQQWRTGVATFAKVAYDEVYPGIDLVYYGNQRELEYDFVVRPGADPRAIALDVEGADRVEIDGQGDLVLHVGGQQVRQRRPVVYQETNGVRTEIDAGYTLEGSGRVAFQLASYDPSRTVVIDPTLVYSTYLGGAGPAGAPTILEGYDWGNDIAVDESGHAYVVGNTFAVDFPTTPGAFDRTKNDGPPPPFPADAFVTKLDLAGATLLYSTYLGGSGDDTGMAIAVDASGSAYVTGYTESPDFPTTPGAFDTSHNGGQRDIFVTKIDPSGSSLAYSTFLGGRDTEYFSDIAVDAAGSAYVAGRTASVDFPTPRGVFQRFGGFFDVFVTKFDPSGATLAYSTFLGGSGDENVGGIAVDAGGAAYVAGVTRSFGFPTTAGAVDPTFNGFFDAFVTKFDATGTVLVYSTFLGGGGDESGGSIAVDAGGNAYVAGSTKSINFPTTAGAFDTSLGGGVDGFVTKLNPAGASLTYSTYLGGTGFSDGALAIAVDARGNAHVIGGTSSADFPTTDNAPDTTLDGFSDAFVTKLNAAGTAPIYSTFLGGTSPDVGTSIAIDGRGAAYVTGTATSADFPTTAGAYDTTSGGAQDAFVTKIADVGVPATLTLLPQTATTPVGWTHCVIGIVRDQIGGPIPNVVLRITVTGAVNTTGSVTTDVNGFALFCYPGPLVPGEDVIAAYADIDDDNLQDDDEPDASARKIWVTPDGRMFGLGRVDQNTQRHHFVFQVAQVLNNDSGTFEFWGSGPGGAVHFSAVDIAAVVFSDDPAFRPGLWPWPAVDTVSFTGVGTVNGVPGYPFEVLVTDRGEPGAGRDTLALVVRDVSGNVVVSVSGILAAGNIDSR